MVRKSFPWLAIFLGLFISVVYGLRKLNPQLTFLYFPTLYLLPAALLLLGKIRFSDLGFRFGKPTNGLFIALLLPAILFLRYKFMGLGFQLIPGWQGLIYGSVGEELFFRGYLQEQFSRFFSSNISIALTNFFFMLVHVVKGYSLLPSLMIFIIGVYFSIGRDKRGGDSTIYSMIAHSLYNLVAVSIPKIL